MRAMRLVFAVALALLAAVPAGASTSQTRPPGSPDLAAMALALNDLPAGAEIDREGYYRQRGWVAAYAREFSLPPRARIGRSRLLSVSHDLGVKATAAEAAAEFRRLLVLLRRRSFRRTLARGLAEEIGAAPASVTVTRPGTAKIGDGAVSILVGMKVERRLLQSSIAFVRVDRVLAIVVLDGAPGRRVRRADANRVTRVAAERMKGGLVPAAVAPPVVAGLVQPGQVLSATRGTWSGDQLTYTFQWERCSHVEPMLGCVELPGATAAAYVVTRGDLASRLRVRVTAGNRFNRLSASSSPTDAVRGAPGAPVATTPPAVDGLAQVGSTLTADPGTWSGAPAEFAYQWRRCHVSTDACTDVGGATEPSYAVQAADSGARLRVLVVATNAAGPGGALTPPTAPVP
jgi:hypothetical protein